MPGFYEYDCVVYAFPTNISKPFSSTNLFEDIEGGACTLTRLNCVQQSLLVNDATARTVHYTHTALASRQRLAVQQICKSQHSRLFNKLCYYTVHCLHVSLLSPLSTASQHYRLHTTTDTSSSFYLFIKRFHKNMTADSTRTGPTRLAKHSQWPQYRKNNSC